MNHSGTVGLATTEAGTVVWATDSEFLVSGWHWYAPVATAGALSPPQITAVRTSSQLSIAIGVVPSAEGNPYNASLTGETVDL